MRRSARRILVALLIGSAVPATAAPLELNAGSAAPADTSSPRATLRSFLDSTNELYEAIEANRFVRRNDATSRALASRVLDCIDASELPDYSRGYKAAEAAISIKEVLDRVALPEWESVPDAADFESAVSVARYRIPGTRLTITRIAEGPRKHEWLFSAGTVERSFQMYADLKSIPYRTDGEPTSPGFYRWYVTAPPNETVGAFVNALPSVFRSRLWGTAAWKWIGLVIASVVSLVAMGLLYRAQRALASRIGAERPIRYALTLSLPLLAAALPAWLESFLTNVLALRGDPQYVASFGANVLSLLALIVVAHALVDRVAAVMIARPSINPRGLDAQVIRILSRLISLALSVLILLEGGQYLGIPVTTLLASAGVGGLAMALAAQDTLRNLFGTVMLMTDKPFRVGERIVAASYDGVVEEIGLRSTRIRLLNGHLVTIPNDTLARKDIENIGRRPFIRRVANLRLPLDTPPDQLAEAVELARDALADHEGMSPDYPPRVYLHEFQDDALVLRLMYWYHPADYWAFAEFSDRLNHRLVQEFASRGIQLKLPTRVAHEPTSDDPAPLRVQVLGEHDESLPRREPKR